MKRPKKKKREKYKISVSSRKAMDEAMKLYGRALKRLASR